MPVETIVVLVPMAAKGVAAGLSSMKAPLAVKLAGATKAGLATKYSLGGQQAGKVILVTASTPNPALSSLAGSGNLAAQLSASQPATTSGAAANTTTGVVATGSLLSKATSLVSQAQSLADTVTNNIVPLIGVIFAGAAGGAAGGGALQARQNKKQKGMIDSLSTQTKAQQQTVENLQSALSATQEKVDQIAADVAEPAVETVEPTPVEPPIVASPEPKDVEKVDQAAVDIAEPVDTAEPVVETVEPAPVEPPVVAGPELEDIIGIGPIFARRLREAGIQTLADLAQLTPDQITEIMEEGERSFSGDPEDWIKQARELAGLDD